MFSISNEKQSSSFLSSISELETIANDFAYDDTIPFQAVESPPTINKGGLNSTSAYTAHSALPPPTSFSAIIDWVGFVFDIESSFRTDQVDRLEKIKAFQSGEISGYQLEQFIALHNVEDKAQNFLIELQKRISLLTFDDSGHGRFAYKHMANLYRDGEHVGTFCYGGTTNKGTAALMLKGMGCSGVDMEQLRSFLEPLPGAHLTRVDVAHDDLNGVKPIEYYVEQYHQGGFFIKGARPKPRNGGDWTTKDDEKGRTFYVGSKRNGKEACIYEKGKQLGDPLSPWVRVEVRLTHEDHIIPFEILSNPDFYLAGAYPVLENLSIFHERCEVIKKHAEIALDALIGHARTSYGKLVNIMVEIGRSPERIISDLIADGTPKRLVLPLPPMPQYEGAIS